MDVTTPQDELVARLSRLIRYEVNLESHGVSCELRKKHSDKGCCLVCPFSLAREAAPEGDSPEELDHARKRLFCQNGQEQQTISILLAAKRVHGVH